MHFIVIIVGIMLWHIKICFAVILCKFATNINIAYYRYVKVSRQHQEVQRQANERHIIVVTRQVPADIQTTENEENVSILNKFLLDTYRHFSGILHWNWGKKWDIVKGSI